MISISLTSRQSTHHAASAETDQPRGLHRWVHRNPPRAARQPLDEALRSARVPPMDYRHKPFDRGVNFGRR